MRGTWEVFPACLAYAGPGGSGCGHTLRDGHFKEGRMHFWITNPSSMGRGEDTTNVVNLWSSQDLTMGLAGASGRNKGTQSLLSPWELRQWLTRDPFLSCPSCLGDIPSQSTHWLYSCAKLVLLAGHLALSFFFFLFKIYLFIFGCIGSSLLQAAFSSCGEWGLLLVAVRGFIAVASLVAEHGL